MVLAILLYAYAEYSKKPLVDPHAHGAGTPHL